MSGSKTMAREVSAQPELMAALAAGGCTIGDLVKAVTIRLAGDAGVDLPNLEARLLVGHGLGLTAAHVFAHPERPLAPAAAAAVRDLAERRCSGEPLAYIVGEREFWSLPFKVSPDVLIPRPDTEHLVETALALTLSARQRLRILDLGTGSGCILLALLSERPTAWGIGIDRSEGAIRIARENARRLGLDARCGFVRADWGSATAGTFDLLIVNPPYIDDTDFPKLPRDVRCFEPTIALRGGADGLAAFRTIAADVRRLMTAEGRAVVEIGDGQARQVAALFEAAGLRPVALVRDLSGRERCVTFARNDARLSETEEMAWKPIGSRLV